MRWSVAALAAVTVVTTLAGCSAIDRYIEPDYDIRGTTVLVIPFRKGNYWHYETKEGNRLGQSIEVALGDKCGGLIAVRNKPLQEEIRRDLRDDIPWADYGARAEVNYLIVGQIESLSYENPNMVGMWQGTVRARYQVYDMSTGELGYSRTIQVKVPENPDGGQIYISFETSKNEIEAALMARAAKEIAGHLCGYEQEGIPQ